MIYIYIGHHYSISWIWNNYSIPEPVRARLARGRGAAGFFLPHGFFSLVGFPPPLAVFLNVPGAHDRMGCWNSQTILGLIVKITANFDGTVCDQFVHEHTTAISLAASEVRHGKPELRRVLASTVWRPSLSVFTLVKAVLGLPLASPLASPPEREPPSPEQRGRWCHPGASSPEPAAASLACQ